MILSAERKELSPKCWFQIKFCCLFVLSAVGVIEISMHLAGNQNISVPMVKLKQSYCQNMIDEIKNKLSSSLSFTIVL